LGSTWWDEIQWEKITVSFRVLEIPKQCKSELKAAMSFISIEPSFPTALTKPIPEELVKEVLEIVNSEDTHDGEIRSVIFDIGRQRFTMKLNFYFLLRKTSPYSLLMHQNLLKILWSFGVEGLRRRLLLEEC